ncbi:MAG TPA: CocE/NonD family hydrolase [Terriglobales bacterium]|nr:CocE/NonD family hydrolase [Terriglobales bacterium]
MKRLLGTLLLLSCAGAHAFAAPANYILQKDVAVPMRDGVVLRADILLPSRTRRFPTLVYRTPYNKEEALKGYLTFQHAVDRGYAVVVQDVRGRYASSGDFAAYQNEGRDGYDTIEWAARQPWSNGNIGTFGLSYPGAVQWLAAVENPPHLEAMVPAMTFSTPRNFFYSSGAFDMSWIAWIWDDIAPDLRVKKNLPGPRTYQEAEVAWPKTKNKMLWTVPLNSLAELRGVAPFYYEWLRHPPDDPWWNWAELRDKYARVHAAVLNLSGWYDEDYGPEGATTNYLGLLVSRKAQRDPRTHLLIGPWIHGVQETAKTKSGEREFGPAAAINYDQVVLDWMDHYLRGINNGVERENPVRLFLMGENRWCNEPTWPPADAKSTSFYLAGGGPGKRGGTLAQAAPSEEEFSVFTSDPAHPVIDPYAGRLGAHDFRELAKRPDVLIFDSEPLTKNIVVLGPITAEIYVSCDCPDFDLWVRLLDVAADGTAFNLMSPGNDVLRASYREPQARRQLLTPGQTYKLTLPNMRTGNVFAAGHRIRVQISSSLFPDFSRNLQSGELETTSATLRKAEIRVYHDREHPSRIVLPVVPR